MIYTIKKGKHYSRPRFPWPILFKKEIRYKVQFNESAKYVSLIPANQFDVNKLIGFGEPNYFKSFLVLLKGLFGGNIAGEFHHDHSARVGWNWNESRQLVELFAYCYVNGERIIQPLGFADTKEPVIIKIELYGYNYKFWAIGSYQDGLVNVVDIRRTKKSKFIFGFRLNPYFGGDEFAPHDIKIKVDKA